MARTIPLLDLAMLWIDGPRTPANVGVLIVLEPPRGRSATAAARRLVAAYRSTPPTAPFDSVPDLAPLRLPQWRRCRDVDLKRHVLLNRLPAPGDEAALCRLVARLHEAPLERDRPLFRLHVIHGLASGRWAVYVKSHHAYWDGRYAMDRIFGRLASEPGPLPPPFFALPDAADVRESPAGAPIDLPAVARLAVGQVAAFGELANRLVTRARDAATGIAGPANRPFGGPHTRLNEPVGAARSFACFDLPLADVRRVARAADGTANDVALAVVDAAVESYLDRCGERPDRPLVAMCPVSLRDPGDLEPTTKAATLFVPLAEPGSAPAARLRQVVASTRAAKSEFRSLSRDAALDYALLAFTLSRAAQGLRLASTPPVINLVVSNVGGVERPLYLGEHRILGAYPVSMLADPTRLNVTIVSTADRMHFGIIADAGAVPDARVLADDCLAAYAHLAAKRRRTARASPARPRRARKRSPTR